MKQTMLLGPLLLLLLVSSAAACNLERFGSEADVSDFPYQAFVKSGTNGRQCGASILNAHFVLTAARCVFNMGTREPMDLSQISVGVGASIEEQVREHQVRSVNIHPSFSPDGGLDAAVIELATPIALGAKAWPVLLATDADEGAKFDVGSKAYVAGWTHACATRSMRGSDLHLISPADPKCRLKANDYEAHVCAYAEGQDGAYGDPGSPLVVRLNDGTNLQVGIMSEGNDESQAGAYMKVSALKKFVDDVMAKARWNSRVIYRADPVIVVPIQLTANTTLVGGASTVSYSLALLLGSLSFLGAFLLL